MTPEPAARLNIDIPTEFDQSRGSLHLVDNILAVMLEVRQEFEEVSKTKV